MSNQPPSAFKPYGVPPQYSAVLSPVKQRDENEEDDEIDFPKRRKTAKQSHDNDLLTKFAEETLGHKANEEKKVLEENIRNLETLVERYKTDLESSDTKIELLQSEKATARKEFEIELNALKEIEKQNKEKIAKLEAETKSMKDTYGLLKHELDKERKKNELFQLSENVPPKESSKGNDQAEEINRLKEKISTLEDSLRREKGSAMRIMSEKQVLANTTSELSQKIEDLNQKLQQQTNKPLEEQITELNNKLNLERRRNAELSELNKKFADLTEQRKQDSLAANRLKFENENLKKKFQNTEILKEQIQTLERELEAKSKIAAECSLLLVRIQELEALKASWEKVLGSVEGFQSPAHIHRTVRNLQADTKQQKQKILKLKSKLKEAREKLQEMDIAINVHQQQRILAEEKARVAETALERNDQWKELLKLENDGTKKLLDSYNLEADTLGNSDTLKTNRIAFLEQEIEKKDKLIAEKEEAVRNIESMLKETAEKSKELLEENEKFSLEVIRLNDEVAGLHERVGLGEFNIETTKALHMTDSPFTTHLMGEIRRLQALVETLSNEKNDEENRIQASASSLYAKSADRTTTKLKESMKKMFLSFRRLCLRVFGWEITFDQNTKLWKFAFWKNKTKYLMFEETDGHHFVICESPFAHQVLVQQLAEKYGIEEGLFMSHLTQQLTNLGSE